MGKTILYTHGYSQTVRGDNNYSILVKGFYHKIKPFIEATCTSSTVFSDPIASHASKYTDYHAPTVHL